MPHPSSPPISLDSPSKPTLLLLFFLAAYTLPKLYSKNYYCVSCAVHSRIVRVRNVIKRRSREPPVRFKRTPEKSGGAKP